MNDTILETERLILRYQQEGDLEFLIALWTNAAITKYVGGPRDKDKLIVSFNDAATNPEKDEFDLWYVALKSTGKLIGMAGLLEKEIENEKYHEINYYMDEEHWNNGYATEMAKGIIQYHHDKKKITTYIAIIEKDNIQSKKVAAKIGMTYWKTVSRSSGEKEIYKN